MSKEKPAEDVTAKPLFTLNTGNVGGPGIIAPRTVKELRQWLKVESDFWSWLADPRFSEHPVLVGRQRQFHADAEIIDHLAHYEQDPVANENSLNVVRSHLETRYNNQRALHSSSPEAKFVAGVREKDIRAAAATMMALVGDPVPNNDRFTQFGYSLAAAFLYGLSTSPKTYERAWNDVHKTVTMEHEALRLAAGDAGDAWAAERDQIENLHVEQRTTFDTDQTKREADFQAQQDDHRDRLKKIEDHYNNQMALRSAVRYFKEKSRAHGKSGRNFAIAAGVVAGVVAVATTAIATLVFSGGDVTKTQIGVTVILGFLVLWLLRLLVRLLLSNVHLATDMRNRATLVQAYLALIRNTGQLKDEDRALIVNLVFRPTADGLVRDDGAPPTPGGILQNWLSGGR